MLWHVVGFCHLFPPPAAAAAAAAAAAVDVDVDVVLVPVVVVIVAEAISLCSSLSSLYDDKAFRITNS